MDDGRKADLAVLREIYEQALRGEPFDLCHWEARWERRFWISMLQKKTMKSKEIYKI